jgi:large subunit ribosomal protein L18
MSNVKKRKKIIRGTSERPRLLVFRSNTTIYGQLIDDVNKKTLFTISGLSKDIDVSKAESKVGASKMIGMAVAEKAKAMSITQIVFDRNGYLYHGRVKALAEGAREGGLEF